MKITVNKTVATLALVTMTTAVTFATGNITIPHVFKSGDAAMAKDVNENWQVLADAVNDIYTKVDALGANQTQTPTDPFTKADDFTVTSANVSVGSIVTVNGISIPVSGGDDYSSVISFEDGNSKKYSLTYLGNAGGDDSPKFGSPAGGSYGSYYADFMSQTSQKTTISGYPVLFHIGYGMGGNNTCQIAIKFDTNTYAFFRKYASSAYMDVVSKADQEKDKNDCKFFLNYINITPAAAS